MIRIIVFCVVSFAFVTNAFCSAVITKLVGRVDVFAYSKQSWQRAKIGLELAEQDKIKTTQTGRAELVYKDGSVIWIKENTELKISSLIQKSREINLTFGKIRLKVSKLMPGEKFVARTPTAVASIRGTELIVIQDEANCQLFVLSGIVEFSDMNFAQLIELVEGQMSAVDVTGKVSQPKEFSDEDLEIIQDETWNEFAPREEVPEKETKNGEAKEVKEELVKLRQEIHNLVDDVKSDVQVIKEYTDEIREADISTGRTLRDAFGNLVRVEQYLLRPDAQTIQFLNLTKRQEYTYKGYFTKEPFSQNARIDSFEAKFSFNMSMPEDITDWPLFVVSKGDELKPKSMLVKFSNGKDSILTEGIYTETKTETGMKTNGEKRWDTTTKYITAGDEWLLDTKSYDKTTDAGKGWFETGQGVGTGGKESLWAWIISSKMRIYQNKDNTKEFTPGIDTEKFVYLGTEIYGINNSGKILTVSDFSGFTSNPFAVLKEIGIQNTMFCRVGDKLLVSENEETTDATVKSRALNEFKSLPEFFSRKNIDIVYTPDILIPIAQKLITQIDKLQLSSAQTY